jgi:hypothetical protein
MKRAKKCLNIAGSIGGSWIGTGAVDGLYGR